jgi:hypothetical protein
VIVVRQKKDRIRILFTCPECGNGCDFGDVKFHDPIEILCNTCRYVRIYGLDREVLRTAYEVIARGRAA